MKLLFRQVVIMVVVMSFVVKEGILALVFGGELMDVVCLNTLLGRTSKDGIRADGLNCQSPHNSTQLHSCAASRSHEKAVSPTLVCHVMHIVMQELTKR